jgi:hypothetical protein
MPQDYQLIINKWIRDASKVKKTEHQVMPWVVVRRGKPDFDCKQHVYHNSVQQGRRSLRKHPFQCHTKP